MKININDELTNTLKVLNYFISLEYAPLENKEGALDNEVWLVNKVKKYPIIRLTQDIGFNDEERLLGIYNSFKNESNIDSPLISICLVNDDLKINHFSEHIIYTSIGTYFFSNSELLTEFTDIDKVLTPIEDVNQEYLDVVKELRRQPSIKKVFSIPTSLKDIPIVYFVVVICLIIHLGAYFVSSAYNDQVTGPLLFGAFYKTLIYGNHEYWRLLTSGFVHYSIIHFYLNMYSLISVGRAIEKQYGKWKTLLTLLLSIVVGNVFLLITSDNIVSLGISAGIYGLVGLSIVFAIETGLFKNKNVRKSFIWMLVINLALSFAPNVSFIGHLGGLLTGLLLGLIFSKKESWRTLRLNTIISSIILAIVLGFFIVKDTKKMPLYNGTDYLYTKALEELKLDWYADYTERNLIKYYEGLNEIYETRESH